MSTAREEKTDHVDKCQTANGAKDLGVPLVLKPSRATRKIKLID